MYAAKKRGPGDEAVMLKQLSTVNSKTLSTSHSFRP